MELPKKEKDMRSESWNVTSLYMVNLFKSLETDVEKYNVGFIGSTEKGMRQCSSVSIVSG
jgi:hypothetical protein